MLEQNNVMIGDISEINATFDSTSYWDSISQDISSYVHDTSTEITATLFDKDENNMGWDYFFSRRTFPDAEQAIVTVTAADATAKELGINKGIFTIARAGSTAGALTVKTIP